MATTYWAFPTQTFTAWDANGDPVAAAEAKYFEAGTSTPLTIYTDTGLSTPHAVPQVADANGVFAVAYISGPDEVKIEVRTSAGALLPGYPVDNITGVPVGGLIASGVTFDPTATLASVEVQAALEELDTLTQRTRNRMIEAETAGSSNAYTLDALGTITAYVDGDIFVLRADRDTGGAATLNVDSVGAKDWKRHDGSTYVAYAANEIRDGNHYWVEYDSGADEFHTIFEMRRPATQAEAEAGTAVAVDMDALRVKQALDQVFTLVTKTADETVNNSTTLQDDDHLVFALAANTTYWVELNLLVQPVNSTPDYKYGWTVPSGCTMFWEFAGAAEWAAGGSLETESTTKTTSSSFTNVMGTRILAFVRNGSTAGNLQFQWAQETAHGSNSKVLKHSHLIIRKLGAT